MSRFSKVALIFALMWMPITASALDFRAVSVPKAILYDAPSLSAKKVLLLSHLYPVEVVVNLGDWLKVRDAQGSMSWIEAKHLSAKRSVLVAKGSAEMRARPEVAADVVAILEKDVVLELVEAKSNNGWLKVKHRDGVTGYILVSSIWGFD